VAAALIHPNWDKPPLGITDGFSLNDREGRGLASLREAAPLIPVDTPIAVTFLPGEDVAARVKATVAVRELGFEPMPHFSARRESPRRMTSRATSRRWSAQAGVSPRVHRRGRPAGAGRTHFDTLGADRDGGVRAQRDQGRGRRRPPGRASPTWTDEQRWDVLVREGGARSRRAAWRRLIVTQFGFDPDAFLAWPLKLRALGIDCAGADRRAGGGRASSACWRSRRAAAWAPRRRCSGSTGFPVTNLLGSAGPGQSLVDALRQGPRARSMAGCAWTSIPSAAW
jgi:methylenetetrahydrofolate reductase (NADPH)